VPLSATTRLDHAGTGQAPAVSAPAFAVPPQRQLSGRLGELSLLQQIAVLAIWPLLEQVLTYLVTLVDTVQAGHINAMAVAAVGVAGYFVWILGMIQSAVGVGAAAIIARAAGARHGRLVNAVLGQSLIMALGAGVLMGMVLFAAAAPISDFVELTGRAREYAVQFLHILALATPMSFMLFVGCACLRGAGNTATPFRIMVAVNVVNVAANCAFVLGPNPLGGHSVAGIAAATSLAWSVGAFSVIVALLRGPRGMHLFPHRLIPEFPLIRRIARIGVPNLAEASGIWMVQFLVLKIIGHVGQMGVPNALGLHAVAVRIELVSQLPGYALSTTAAILAGQYLGLGEPGRAKRAVLLCWLAAMAIMGTMGLAFLLVPRPLVTIVTNDAAIVRDAPVLLRICGPTQIFMATYLVLSQAMRGAGDTRTPMMLSYFSMFCVRLPATYILGVVIGGKLVGVWFALCGEVVFRGIIFALRFWQGTWLKANV
jgi:MATE family, multidrug efflux pump